VQLRSKELGPVLQLFERVEQLDPNNTDILAEHAIAPAQAGRLTEAEVKHRKAMRLNPFYPDWFLWYLADIYFWMESYADVP
jgi:Flp pilus assembly protein TadD